MTCIHPRNNILPYAILHNRHIVYAIYTRWKGQVRFYTVCTQKPYQWDFLPRLIEQLKRHNSGNTASTKRFGKNWRPTFYIAGTASYTKSLKIEKQINKYVADHRNHLV